MDTENTLDNALPAPQNVTNEVMDALDGMNPELTWASEWGETTHAMLSMITGRHYRKKRATLLHLADAAMLNLAQATVYRKHDCASKVAHYKWRKQDPAYEAAYAYLVGSHEQPGLSRDARAQELDEDEKRGVLALEEARISLRVASADAVAMLIEALQASYKTGPAWRERIQAAQAILDRADSVTAQKGSLEITTVERAIIQVYGDASIQSAGLEAAGLPAGEASQDSVSSHDNVIDGVLVAATKPTQDSVSPTRDDEAHSPGSHDGGESQRDEGRDSVPSLEPDELPLTGRQLAELRAKAEALLS